MIRLTESFPDSLWRQVNTTSVSKCKMVSKNVLHFDTEGVLVYTGESKGSYGKALFIWRDGVHSLKGTICKK